VSGAVRLTLAAILAISACAHKGGTPPLPPPPVASECVKQAGRGDNPFVVVYDARTRLIHRPAAKVHAGTNIRLCVDNVDMRFRTTLTVTETPLPPVADATSLLKGLGQPGDGKRGPPPALDVALQRAQEAIAKITGQFALLSGGKFVGKADVDRKVVHEARQSFAMFADAFGRETAPADGARDFATILPKWVAAAKALETHLELAERNQFDVPTGSDVKVEITIRGIGIALETTQVTGLLVPTVTAPVEDRDKTTLEVRALSYARVSPGLTLSSVRNRSFTITANEIGAQTITAREDGAAFPTMFFSHYWCAVDVRETQPFDFSRSCWWANLLPSLAVGLPLSRDPLENVLIGALWQPFPGISLIAGRHYGHLPRLRRGFVEGSAPPPGVTGFRIEDAVEKDWVYGGYLGIALSDAAFMTVLKTLTK
jgi:hypothetical protein